MGREDRHLRTVPAGPEPTGEGDPMREDRLGPDEMEMDPQLRARVDVIRARMAGKTMAQRRKELLAMRFGKDGTIYTGPQPVPPLDDADVPEPPSSAP